MTASISATHSVQPHGCVSSPPPERPGHQHQTNRSSLPPSPRERVRDVLHNLHIPDPTSHISHLVSHIPHLPSRTASEIPASKAVSGPQLFTFTLCLLLTGCGKPPGPGGPPMGGAFPVAAVVAKAQPETLSETVSVIGTIESTDAMMVVSELDSTVREILFTEGQQVEQDAVLVRLDDVATQARLAEAKAAHAMAKLSYDRNRKLLANDTISQQEFDESDTTFQDRTAALALAQDEQEKTQITAPFAGVVGERNISVGQFVTRAESLTELVRLDPLDVTFSVPERKLGKLRSDLSISFVPDAFPDNTVTGSVTFVAPQVDTRSRTIRAKASLANEDGKLRPGMFGRVTLAIDQKENALTIPESAVQLSGTGATVIRIDDEGKATFAPVQLGQRFKGRVEVIDGLAAGDLVVAEGWQKMGPGSPVIASPESADHGVTPGPLGPMPTAESEPAPGA